MTLIDETVDKLAGDGSPGTPDGTDARGADSLIQHDEDLTRLHEDYLREREFAGRVSPATLRSEAESFALLRKLVPGVSLEDLTRQGMVAFFECVSNRPRRVGRGNETRTGVKPTTIAVHRNNLKQFCKWLLVRGQLRENPLDAIKAPVLHYADRKYLAKAEVERLMAALVTARWRSALVATRNKALLLTLLFCGLRRGELLALRVFDVDLKDRTLVVWGEGSKSRRQRVIPLHPVAAEALRAYMKERGRLFQTPQLFVCSRDDKGLRARGLQRVMEKLQEASGVKFHLHQFRHTFAVNLLHAKCDVMKVKDLLGHSDISQTMLYLRCLPCSASRGDIDRLSFDTLL